MYLIEKPTDQHGNRAHTNSQPQVIEVAPEDGTWMTVIAPESFKRRWPRLLVDMVRIRWKETTGPARLLTEEEWEALIR